MISLKDFKPLFHIKKICTHVISWCFLAPFRGAWMRSFVLTKKWFYWRWINVDIPWHLLQRCWRPEFFHRSDPWIRWKRNRSKVVQARLGRMKIGVLDFFWRNLTFTLEETFPCKPGLAKIFVKLALQPSLFQNPVIKICQDDREVVLAATSARGSSLVHASQRLRQERAVVLSAVSLGSQIDGRPDCLGVFVGDAQ